MVCSYTLNLTYGTLAGKAANADLPQHLLFTAKFGMWFSILKISPYIFINNTAKL